MTRSAAKKVADHKPAPPPSPEVEAPVETVEAPAVEQASAEADPGVWTDVPTETTTVPADALTTPADDSGSDYTPEPPPGSDVTAVTPTVLTADTAPDTAGDAGPHEYTPAPTEASSAELPASDAEGAVDATVDGEPDLLDADCGDPQAETLADAAPLVPPVEETPVPEVEAPAPVVSAIAPLEPPAPPAPTPEPEAPRLPHPSDIGVERVKDAPYVYDVATGQVPDPDTAFVRLNPVSAIWICQHRLIERIDNDGNATIERLLLPAGAEVELWQAEQVSQRLRELREDAAEVAEAGDSPQE